MIIFEKNRNKIAKYSLLFSILSSIAFGLFLFVPMIVSQILAKWFSYDMSTTDYINHAIFIIICTSILLTVFNFCYQLHRHRWSGLITWEKSVLYVAIVVALFSILVNIYFKII